MRISIILCVSFCLGWSVGARHAHGAFDRPSFDALADLKKMEIVLGSLNWRDQQLSNISYSVVETVFNGDELVRQSRFDYKRLGPQYQLHCRHLKTTGGVPLSEYWVNWDGRQSASFTKRGSRLSGIIRAQDTRFLQQVLYSNLLGVRIERMPLTVPEWITEYTMKPKPPGPFEIKTSMTAGGVQIQVALKGGPDHIDVYVIEPDRDYMIVQYRIEHVKQPTRKPSITADVIAASNESGLWVPLKVRHVSTPPSAARRTYEVEHFARGSVRPEVLQVDFPVGTRVLDTVNKTSYTIEKDGKQHRALYYDPGTGQVFDGDGRVVGGTTRPATTAPGSPK